MPTGTASPHHQADAPRLIYRSRSRQEAISVPRASSIIKPPLGTNNHFHSTSLKSTLLVPISASARPQTSRSSTTFGPRPQTSHPVCPHVIVASEGSAVLSTAPRDVRTDSSVGATARKRTMTTTALTTARTMLMKVRLRIVNADMVTAVRLTLQARPSLLTGISRSHLNTLLAMTSNRLSMGSLLS